MTTSETLPTVPVRLDFEHHAPDFYRAVVHLDHTATKQLDKAQFDPRLRELVRIRASQINGCAYCIDMHTKDLRADGETEQRLYLLSVHREAPCYSDRERAALAWTEALTVLGEHGVPDALFDEVRHHFQDAELAELTLAVATINAWNRMNIAMRTPAGGYTPKPR